MPEVPRGAAGDILLDTNAQAECSQPAEQAKHPFVSVVIPVWNDSARLARCLALLEEQTYPGDRYEVVVVDNDSGEDIAATVRACPHALYTFEATPTVYAARNTGIAEARGEVIAFTDADCLPEPDWIEKGTACLIEAAGCGLVAGEITPILANPGRPQWLDLLGLTEFPQKAFAERKKFGATANVFTYRRMFELVGPFIAHLKSAGDEEWGQRVAGAGYSVVYGAEACVRHPLRPSLRSYLYKAMRNAGGIYDITPARPGARLKLIAGQILRPYLKILRVLRGPHFDLDQRLQLAAILLCVGWVRAYEYTRLALGGASRR